jgi:hypothetical protein
MNYVIILGDLGLVHTSEFCFHKSRSHGSAPINSMPKIVSTPQSFFFKLNARFCGKNDNFPFNYKLFL